MTIAEKLFLKAWVFKWRYTVPAGVVILNGRVECNMCMCVSCVFSWNIPNIYLYKYIRNFHIEINTSQGVEHCIAQEWIQDCYLTNLFYVIIKVQ